MAQSDSEKELKVFTGADVRSRWLLSGLQQAITRTKKIDICVSFVMESGVRQILSDLQYLKEKRIPIRIVCGTYLGITQPSALTLLKSVLSREDEIRLYTDPSRSFHPKAYLFEMEDEKQIFIGSSNLSLSALTNGVEWNYCLSSREDEESVTLFFQEFEQIFQQADLLDDALLKQYEKAWIQPEVYRDLEKLDWKQGQSPQTTVLEPRGPQIQALYGLEQMRRQGAEKALVQAATGVGKTYLAAFDARNYQRILFVAHTREILLQAANSFQAVMPERSVGFFWDGQKNTTADMIFASVQTLGNPEYLDPSWFEHDAFQYIVIDECHHMAAKSYRRILDYFRPSFLLGLTATPFRLDGKDIYQLLDYNVAYEIDLFQAINQGALVPFHYYGIYDDTDYQKVPQQKGHYDSAVLSALFRNNRSRTLKILEHVRKHAASRILAFCTDKAHAEFMAEVFQEAGIPAAAVHSSSRKHRDEAIRELEEGTLNVLCTVDMFNEGVDIPGIDMVLFLRPTESTAIFLQQLGRGLRKAKDKEYLTVLDFIGNYQMAGRIPSLLSNTAGMNVTGLKNLPVPRNCLIDFDLELIDLLKQMEEKARPVQEKIAALIREYQECSGRIPTRCELMAAMDEPLYQICMQRSRLNVFKNYRQFLLEHQFPVPAMAEEEIEFLHLVETTSMTKVYKMPVLFSFLCESGLKEGVSKEELLAAWNQFFAKDRNWQDLKLNSRLELELQSRKKQLQTILNNPVHFLIQSGKDWFVKRDGYEIALSPKLLPYLGHPEFIEEFKDILEYRSQDYYKRRYETQRFQA